MADGYSFSFNNAVFPISLPILEPILAKNDPVLYLLSSYITTCCQVYLGPAFTSEMQTAGLTSAKIPNIKDGYVVGSCIGNPLNANILQSTKLNFPLMSIYRESEEYEQHSLRSVMTVGQFVIQFVLPPLTQPQNNRLYSFLHALSETFLATMFQGANPNFQANTPIFRNAGVAWLKLQGSKYSPIRLSIEDDKGNASHLYFPSITLRCQVAEQQKQVASNYVSLSDIHIAPTIQSDTLSQPPYALSDGYVRPNITVASLLPAVGNVSGGTILNIAGTGLVNVVSATICNVPLTILRTTNSAIIAQTLPTLDTGIGNLVLTDKTGKTYSFSNLFTYTD